MTQCSNRVTAVPPWKGHGFAAPFTARRKRMTFTSEIWRTLWRTTSGRPELRRFLPLVGILSIKLLRYILIIINIYIHIHGVLVEIADTLQWSIDAMEHPPFLAYFPIQIKSSIYRISHCHVWLPESKLSRRTRVVYFALSPKPPGPSCEQTLAISSTGRVMGNVWHVTVCWMVLWYLYYCTCDSTYRQCVLSCWMWIWVVCKQNSMEPSSIHL